MSFDSGTSPGWVMMYHFTSSLFVEIRTQLCFNYTSLNCGGRHVSKTFFKTDNCSPGGYPGNLPPWVPCPPKKPPALPVLPWTEEPFAARVDDHPKTHSIRASAVVVRCPNQARHGDDIAYEMIDPDVGRMS